MAKEKVKLSEIKPEEVILINGLKYKFTGFEKRRTNLGKQEMFVFKIIEETIPEGASRERLFVRWTFQNTQIVKIKNGFYEWH